ncbi:MAG: hypothetical protein ABWY57_01445 [Mycetocola sp.]
MRRLIGVAATLTLIAITTLAYAATPEVVLDEPGVSEGVPSASGGYLAWTANSEAKPNRFNSYVQQGAGPVVRVNPKGTQSFFAAIDGTTVVYQEGSHDAWNLRFFDAVTEGRSDPPDGVNTPSIEYNPSLSGDWLLFSRTNGNRVKFRDAWVKVVLFDLAAGTGTVLEKSPLRGHYLEADQVNGNWATFESCRFRRGDFSHCQVSLYDISADSLTEVANPSVQQYAGAVADDGTVYLVRNRGRDHWKCGNHTRVVRMDGGNGTVIAELPDGRDIYNMFVLDGPGGSTTLYFDRFRCKTGESTGIYRIPNAETAS